MMKSQNFTKSGKITQKRVTINNTEKQVLKFHSS